MSQWLKPSRCQQPARVAGITLIRQKSRGRPVSTSHSQNKHVGHKHIGSGQSTQHSQNVCKQLCRYASLMSEYTLNSDPFPFCRRFILNPRMVFIHGGRALEPRHVVQTGFAVITCVPPSRMSPRRIGDGLDYDTEHLQPLLR